MSKMSSADSGIVEIKLHGCAASILKQAVDGNTFSCPGRVKDAA